MMFPLLAMEGIEFFSKPESSDITIMVVVISVIGITVLWWAYGNFRSSDKSGTFARHDLKETGRKNSAFPASTSRS